MPATLEKPINSSPGLWSGLIKSRRRAVSATIAALLVFALVNLALFVAVPQRSVTNKDLWSGSGSIDLALSDLQNLRNRPNIVLLGSSLVMFPFWAMDVEANPKIADIFHHHFSHTFEKLLDKVHVWAHPTVFNLAIFGQMASDGYIFLDQFLKGSKAPDVLVVGIAPRDFSDSDLATPMATLTFRRLVNLENFGHLAPFYLPSWKDKTEFVAEHLCFFYEHRWHLQHEVDKAWLKTYSLILGTDSGAKNETAIAGFRMESDNNKRWENSIAEYRRRYHNIENHDLDVQMSFINHTLDLCRQRHIKLVIVNMPLTQINRNLLPAGFYSLFRSRLSDICEGSDVRFVDLGDDPEFQTTDFWDTCHLGHLGGHKLISKLVPVIADLEKGKESLSIRQQPLTLNVSR